MRETSNAAGRPRAIFFGTPEFAVPCLDAVCELADVVLVVTQPDRPSGRGMKLAAPPVKLLARERGIEVMQPRKVRTAEFAAALAAANADVGVVVAYGRILPRAVLDAPRLGCVNVHASLLPELRGAAPIQWSIINGAQRTGVCLMKMDEGMDTGDVLARAELSIDAQETAAALSERLSKLGAELLRRELVRYLAGELQPEPQDHARATLAPILEKAHGRVDWRAPAQSIHDLIRGTQPWPGAFTFFAGQRIKLHRARVVLATSQPADPGVVVRADRHAIEVACGTGVLALEELQPEGKRKMSAADFIAGTRLRQGASFATTPGAEPLAGGSGHP
jgi:methionyl-tRNA formyltransferase